MNCERFHESTSLLAYLSNYGSRRNEVLKVLVEEARECHLCEEEGHCKSEPYYGLGEKLTKGGSK